MDFWISAGLGSWSRGFRSGVCEACIDVIPFTVLSSSHQVDWFGVALQRGLAKGFSPTHPLQVSAAQVDGVVFASYAGEEHAGEEQAGGVASGGDPQPLYRLKCEVVRIDHTVCTVGGLAAAWFWNRASCFAEKLLYEVWQNANSILWW